MNEHELIGKIPAYVDLLTSKMEQAGKRAYLVGGCVRDLLRGVAPHDFDMTTNATPEESMAILSDLRVIPTGIAHGTVTVIVDGHPIELTTHRTDGVYRDSRHPDSVTFTSDLTEDLARRDFTVNAMALDRSLGIIDPFGGRCDLARGIIRAVGDPMLRFGEDALRILRAFRFAARLDFTIEEGTRQAARALSAGLAEISVERIFSELSGTLIAPAAAKGLAAMRDADCLPYVFFDTAPDLSLLDALGTLPPDAALRLSLLLHREAPDAARALCRRWHTSNAFSDALASYLAILGDPLPTTPFEARRFVCRHFPHWEKGLSLHQALHGNNAANARSICSTVFRDKTAVELRRLAVNGRELQQNAGVRAAATAAMLARLQEHVWRYPDQNHKQTLLALAREWVEQEPHLYA